MDAMIVEILKAYGPVGVAGAAFYFAWRDMGRRLSEVTDRFIDYLEIHSEQDRAADALVAAEVARSSAEVQRNHIELMAAIERSRAQAADK